MPAENNNVIATGALVFLPLHAAWTQEGQSKRRCYVLDRRILSYAPTAFALLAARHSSALTQLTASMLAVQEPQPVSGPPLPEVGAEVAAATASLESASVAVLKGDQASLEAVERDLPRVASAHFACHAASVMQDPLRSGILLVDDQRLTFERIASLDLRNLALAVLSACETGVPGQDAPDEAIGIATAFLGAGAAGVVSSLWSVEDSSTMLLITRFYELWRGEPERQDGAAALVLAQRWLRDTTNGQKLSHWEERRALRTLPDTTYRAIRRELLLRLPDNRDFEHPLCWAAFGYTGAW